ncbi:MAG: ATP-binding cassette domain-containing protein [Chloroflexota bacterium]|nr:MAG: ATP-binding cassette domain-containing protein [Chloroflexota bacterium]
MVQTRGLGKRYGSTWAVQGLDLTVRRGEIYGFLGPNGAGKTTTLLMLLGIERPTTGSIEILGHSMPVDPYVVNPRVGVVTEQQHLYDDLSAWDYLMFFARLYEVRQPEHRATELLDRFNLSQFRRLRARDYSRGMQQKLGLARALLHRPELLVLDEPVSGLDPHGIRQVREVLAEERTRGATILLSSHILSEIERTADRVGILLGGRLIAEDDVARIGARLESGPAIDVDVEHLTEDLIAAVRHQPFVLGMDVEAAAPDRGNATLRIRVDGTEDHRRAISALVTENGGLIVQMRQPRVSLEDAFVRLTAENVAELAKSTRAMEDESGPKLKRKDGSAPLAPLDAGREPRIAKPRLGTRSGGRSRLRQRLHAIGTVALHDLVAILLSAGPYVTLALGMVVAVVLLRGQLDALERNQVLVLSDAFSLPLFVATTLAMLFLALGSVATVARDREQGTLETLFYAPIDQAAYLLGKLAALIGTYLAMALAIGVLFAVDAAMTGLRIGGSLLPELLLSLMTAAATIALGLLLSSASRGLRSAFALFTAVALLLLAARFSSEILSGITVANNYSPLLYARDLAIVVDRVLGYVSPFATLESGIDAVVRADLLGYAWALALSTAQCIGLLAAATRWLAHHGVRR